MPYPKNFHRIILHSVYNDVRSVAHDPFASSLNVALLSNVGMVT